VQMKNALSDMVVTLLGTMNVFSAKQNANA
jgi:hypothetical protein